MDSLEVLNRFVAREGHANVPWDHIEDGFLLGKWVGAKRAQYRRGRIRPDREVTLAALPGWTWDAVRGQWETGYRAVLAFRDREGHIAVPAEHRTDDGFPLGSIGSAPTIVGSRAAPISRSSRQPARAVPAPPPRWGR